MGPESLPLLPIHDPELWRRLPVFAASVFAAVRCLSLFFRRVLGIPYSVGYEVFIGLLTTGALAIFFVPDFRASAVLAAILLGGSAWGTWATWRDDEKKKRDVDA